MFKRKSIPIEDFADRAFPNVSMEESRKEIKFVINQVKKANYWFYAVTYSY